MSIANGTPDVFVVEKLGRTQSLTPDGYLLCEGVRIARTGPMLYRNDEMPEIAPGSNGSLLITREADVLFSAETIASFNGKPVTSDHPPEMVSPDTWKKITIGVTLNPRRGTGIDADYLLADLLIQDASGIADVGAGKREVSCGYDSEAETVKPGIGRITRIIGNHVALVERGRCGPACAIQDGDPNMAQKAKRSVWDRLVTAFKAQDEAAFSEELEAAKEQSEGGDENENHIHIHLPEGKKPEDEPVKDDGEEQAPDPAEARFAKIEAVLADLSAKVGDLLKAEKSEAESHEELLTDAEEEPAKETAKEEAEAEKKPAMDSAALVDEWRAVMSGAEILAPGLTLPKFDSAKARKYTVDSMCVLRRKALEKALADNDRRGFVEAIAGKLPDIKKMTCDAASLAFNGAVELAKASNKTRVVAPKTDSHSGPMTAEKYAAMLKQRRAK